MPPAEYNNEACRERHLAIEHRFVSLEAWLEKQDRRLWGLVLLGVSNLIGIVALLISKSL